MADEVKVQGSTPAAETAAETPAAPAASTPSAPSGPSGQSSHAGPGGPRGPRTGPRPGGGRDGGRKYFRRKKVCKFCVEKIDRIDFKDTRLLGQFVAESGKIVPRRITGVCTPHQRRLSLAIKQARNIALLPFAAVKNQ